MMRKKLLVGGRWGHGSAVRNTLGGLETQLSS